ncbi:MAG: TRAP transporter small permease subunit [Nitrosospira sp.]|nr:TRAP transporter small permease subunit [Nitrosospira sp.]
MTRQFIIFVQVLSRAGGVLSALLLIFAMLVICQMILVRYVFQLSTTWQTDAIVLAATASFFIGAPYVLLTKGHVGVDFIQMVVRPKVRDRLELIGSLCGLLFCLIMSIATAIHLQEAIVGGWTTPSLVPIPLWAPLSPMLAGFVLLSLQYCAQLIESTGRPS